MEFGKTNKKLKYIIVSEIIVEPENAEEIQEVLEKAREQGESEIVDIQLIEEE